MPSLPVLTNWIRTIIRTTRAALVGYALAGIIQR
jgi:hypothetical protein